MMYLTVKNNVDGRRGLFARRGCKFAIYKFGGRVRIWRHVAVSVRVSIAEKVHARTRTHTHTHVQTHVHTVYTHLGRENFFLG